jgi:hypothetical protein
MPILASILLAVFLSPAAWSSAQSPQCGMYFDAEATKAYLEQTVDPRRPDTSVILISRLGRYERAGSLQRQRALGIRQYLLDHRFTFGDLQPSDIVIASGQRGAGAGEIEVYVNGKLAATICFTRNRRVDWRLD